MWLLIASFVLIGSLTWALVPLPSLRPSVKKLHTPSLSKKLKLKTADSKSEDESKKKKPLTLILSWMSAKESHLEKYRTLFIKRGFDVLTVKIAPKDIFFPVFGSQVIVTDVLDYLNNNNQYDKIIVHAFSAGGYIMGEMLVKIRDNNEKYKNILPRIQGVILDSIVDAEAGPVSFSRAVSTNPIIIKILEWCVATFLRVMYNFSTRHHVRSSKNFHNTPLRCPALMFVSEADKAGTPSQNKLIAKNWEARGVDVRFKCFKESQHVGHMHKYPEEYVAEIDSFLKKLNITSSKL